MRKGQRAKGKGFTLIELLVVISIIGLLAAAGLTVFSSAQRRARQARRIADLRALYTALESYYTENNVYPSSIGGGGNWDGIYSCWGDSTPNWISGLVPDYMLSLPRDPRNHTNCGQQYIYQSNGADFKLISHSPEDCAGVKAKYPNLIDPTRDCWAYGYWSPGARTW